MKRFTTIKRKRRQSVSSVFSEKANDERIKQIANVDANKGKPDLNARRARKKGRKERKAERKANQTNRKTNRKTDRKGTRKTDRKTNRKTDRKETRKTDHKGTSKVDRNTDRKSDRNSTRKANNDANTVTTIVKGLDTGQSTHASNQSTINSILQTTDDINNTPSILNMIKQPTNTDTMAIEDSHTITEQKTVITLERLDTNTEQPNEQLDDHPDDTTTQDMTQDRTEERSAADIIEIHRPILDGGATDIMDNVTNYIRSESSDDDLKRRIISSTRDIANLNYRVDYEDDRDSDDSTNSNDPIVERIDDLIVYHRRLDRRIHTSVNYNGIKVVTKANEVEYHDKIEYCLNSIKLIGLLSGRDFEPIHTFVEHITSTSSGIDRPKQYAIIDALHSFLKHQVERTYNI